MDNIITTEKKDKSLNEYRIVNKDDFEIDGMIYIIPDTFLEHTQLPIEQYKLYKWIIVFLLDYYNKKNDKKNDKINKKLYNDILTSAEKIFAIIITGYDCDNQYLTLSVIEKQILKKIPQSILSTIQTNKNIIEKMY